MKILIASSIALLILLGGYFAYKRVFTKTTSFPQVSINKSNSTGGDGDSKAPVATANPNVPGGNTGSNAGAQAELIAPSGNFVSSHTLPLSASAESVCITTINAVCEITFTNGSTSKSLGSGQAKAGRTDQNGTVTWPVWTPASLGLTPGSWTITAKASLGAQSKTTVDTVKLVVTQ